MTSQRQNADELRAKKWLINQGHSDIRRPDDDPPDFVVDGSFAVEVMRLNQRIKVGGGRSTVGEEERRLPLTHSIEKVLNKLGVPGNKGKSWIIDCEYNFKKPRPKASIVESQMMEALEPLLKPYDDTVVSRIHSRYFDCERHAGETGYLGFPHLCLECGICLVLREFSHGPSSFCLQNVSDGHGIGIAEELARGIKNCIDDKSEKVRNKDRINKYRRWWLILVDYVCHVPIHFLSKHERSLIRNQNSDFWSRIVIVSSKNFDWHYELLASDTDQSNSLLPR